jgi:hypothetical protein
VHPGEYVFEHGTEVSHELTVIGVGGATQNLINICEDLCVLALFAVEPHSGVVTIDGLTMKRSGHYVGGTTGVRIYSNVNGVVVRNCTFYDLNGFGIYTDTYGSNIHIERNLFFGGDDWGDPDSWGVRMPAGAGEIKGNTFVNSVITFGESDLATPSFSSNIFYATEIRCRQGGDPTFICNDSWGSVYQGCPDPTGTHNNFAADPLFCDLPSRDFRLRPGSPCLPENSPAGCGLVGAFGPCDLLAVQPTDAPSLAHLTVSPNPSSGEVVFSLIGITNPGVLEIFDAHGRQVDVLRPLAGQITWNPSRNLTRGIYFARAMGERGNVVKFVLLR